jgi:hypothetical protein
VQALRLQQILWNNLSNKKWRNALVCADILVERNFNLNAEVEVTFNGNTKCHTGQGGTAVVVLWYRK